jgi:ATP/maltotriose-dependent transcriptional regulator MalT
MLEPHVVATRFIIPPLRAQLLPRSPLIERLNQDSRLPLVLNNLSASREETTPIVDDYHLIEEPIIHSSITFLLNHAPVIRNLPA